MAGVKIEENPTASIFDTDAEWSLVREFIQQNGGVEKTQETYGLKISRKDLKNFLSTHTDVGIRLGIDQDGVNHSFLLFQDKLGVKARWKSYLNADGKLCKEGILGKGMFSRVYPVCVQGVNTHERTTLAIKFLHEISEGLQEKHEEEVENLNILGRNASLLFDHKRQKSLIVQKFIKGITLKKFLDENEGQLSPKVKIAIALGLIEALEEMRVKGIFHDDLNACNTMVDFDPKYPRGVQVSVVDLGRVLFSFYYIRRLMKVIKDMLHLYNLAPVFHEGHQRGLLLDLEHQRDYAIDDNKAQVVEGKSLSEASEFWRTDEGKKIRLRIERVADKVYLERLTDVLENMYPLSTDAEGIIIYPPKVIEQLSSYSSHRENTISCEVQRRLTENQNQATDCQGGTEAQTHMEMPSLKTCLMAGAAAGLFVAYGLYETYANNEDQIATYSLVPKF